MARVKRGTTVKRRHKKLLKLTKGFRHGRKNLFKQAKQAVLKAKAYSYRDRRVKKREFRSLWIVRVNAAAKANGISYRDLIHGLKLANNPINRKSLAHLALHEEGMFKEIVNQAKTALKK